MSSMENEELLRELAQLEERAGDEIPSVELLAAYREGRLPHDEAERLEARLADDPVARERLASLAGVPLPRPPERVRAAVLAAAPRRKVRRFPIPWQGWAAAAGIVLAVAALPFVLPGRHGEGRPLPAYSVSITGLALERSRPMASDRSVEARPETRIEIDVAPEDRAVEGVDLALYRRVAGGVERLVEGPKLRQVENRGAAAFEGRAGDLVGPEPGERELLVVVARRGDLPDGLRLRPDEDAAAALAGRGERRVYSLRVKLLPSP